MIEVSCSFKTKKDKSKSYFNLNKILELKDFSNYTLLINGKSLFEEEKISIFGHNPILTIYHDYCFDHQKNQFYKIENFDFFFDSFYKKNSIFSSKKKTFQGGLLGYFSYDYKNLLEKNQFQNFEQFTSLVELVLYGNIEVCHLDTEEVILIEQKVQKNFLQKINNSQKETKTPLSQVQQNQEEIYKNSIDKIKEYIKKGDTYQVNLSYGEVKKISYSIEEMAIFCFKDNPAPYQGIHKNEQFGILSTSPERLLYYNNGKVDSCPIKGTISRGINEVEDKRNKERLLSSKKDLAELAMIVDLIRNDLYKVCDEVKQPIFPYLLTYKNVYHLASLIQGKTKKNPLEILQALFPGGSISGCPKIRACQIIDELEKQSRNIYTGSMGYFSFNHISEFNILIRSAVFCQNKIYYRVGGGITLLSEKMDEYQETVSKKKTFQDFFQYHKE